MTQDLEINLPCTKHTDGAQSCLVRIVPDAEQTTLEQALLEACDACKANYVIGNLMAKLQAVEQRPGPLLQCITCGNTESPAGAMARYFNQGRCLHCAGYFKVVRA